MAGYGWSYLTVVHDQSSGDASIGGADARAAHRPGAEAGVAPFTASQAATSPSAAPNEALARRFRASDSSAFTSEAEMFRELGVTGWELVSLRESRGHLVYYFKRPRA